MKKWLGFFIVALIGIVGALAVFLYPTYQHLLKMQKISVDSELTIFIGGGGNSMVLFSPDHRQVLVVDTKMSSGSTALREFVDSMGKDLDITIVNTHYHPDHAGGNHLFPEAKIISGAYDPDVWEKEVGDRYPDETVQIGEEKILHIGPETVILHNYGRAHTFNDMTVYLENRKLLMTGDLLFMNMHPVLRQDSGVSVADWILVLDQMVKDFPSAEQFLPGHGEIQEPDGVSVMRNYFTSIQDSLNDPGKLANLKKQYSSYYSLPFMSSFDKTVETLKLEKGTD